MIKAVGKETKRLPMEKRSRQNKPILSETKGERVYASEPIDEMSWAYLKLLRERDKTKKIYPVNPYAEVYQFRDNLYGIFTESLDGMGDPWMYLIVGPEKAMLIDTGFGLGDLKGLVREIIGEKELIVANTHCHYDHAYGNAQFSRVYCHEYEAPAVRQQDEHIWDYLFEEDTQRGIWAEFNREDLIAFTDYEVVGCPDGYVFDLGDGYEVELVHLGGHSAGHAGYLDRQNKAFFAGDDVISMRIGVNGGRPDRPYPEYASIEAMRDSFRRLAERIETFDHVFTGHHITDLENTVILNILAACEAVCRDPEGSCTYKRESRGEMKYYRYVEGLGTLMYTMHSVYKDRSAADRN